MRLILLLSLLAGPGLRTTPPPATHEAGAQMPSDVDLRIPAGVRVYIAPIDGGYDNYLAAALHKKAVPLIIVTDRSKADFEISGVTESEKAGWAKMLFFKSTSSSEQASIKVLNIKTGTIVYGYNVNKSSSARGKQSSSEACADVQSAAQSGAKTSLKPGAKIYVNAMPDHFDDFLKAAIAKKKVPVVVVDSKEAAEFEISGTSETQQASAAKKAFLMNFHSTEQASITVADLNSGEITFAYSVAKKNSAHGKQSTAEACAKHLKDEIEKKR